MSNPEPLTTRCLCGDTSLTVVPKSMEIGACHCNTCRKWSGGPFLAIESEQVSLTGNNVGHYDSSEWAERVFCQQCGTHLFYKLKDGHAHYVPVGLFAQQQDMVRAIEASGIEPVIDRCFALDELAQAFRYQESGQHFGKIGITI